MKISIFGLGYVGLVSAACFAKLGHKVIGVDIIDSKIDRINKGITPIEEKGLRELVYEQHKNKNLLATKDSLFAVSNSDISFLCLGTPPKRDGNLDLSILISVCEEIGKALREKDYHLLVIRSTIFPGSLEILKKTLEDFSGKKCGKDFDLTTNPEFLREGSAIKDFFNPPYIIVGADSEEIGKRVLDYYEKIEVKKFIVDLPLSQMIKYVNNSWHALKIDFANEIGAVCKKLKIDSKPLMKLFCEDKQLNLSAYYLEPGFAYGGSCLPKDTSALKNNAFKLGLKTPLINSISESNYEQINRAIELIESKGKEKLGFLGLTFKADTDDIRGNPLLLIINTLIDKGFKIKIYDKILNKQTIKNLNESYRKEVYDLISQTDLKTKVIDLSSLLADIKEVFDQDIIIISNRDLLLKEVLSELPKNKIIIDLQNLFSASDFKAEYDHL